MNQSADEAALVLRLAEAWLEGEPVDVLATIGQVECERYRVRGLDEDGDPLPVGRSDRSMERIVEQFEEISALRYVAVEGDAPGCDAVAMGRDLIEDFRRTPLAERPDDAILEIALELPATAIRHVERRRQRGVPELRGGPRHVQLHFADGSIARVRTDEAGLRSLTRV